MSTWMILRVTARSGRCAPANDCPMRDAKSTMRGATNAAPLQGKGWGWGNPTSSGVTIVNGSDVGVFAHNGSHYSAPAFVTFYSLDSEARTYDDKGAVVEIGYGMGTTELKVADFGKLFAARGWGRTGRTRWTRRASARS